jgi:UMF1 family MFS transporter
MQTASPSVVRGWTMYDWANSVYNLVITSTIFPAYYAAVTGDGNDKTLVDTVTIFGRTFVNTALYNYTLGIAFIIVALMSPLLSSIADLKETKSRSCFSFVQWEVLRAAPYTFSMKPICGLVYYA